MGSGIPRGRLDEIVRDARARTGVPGVAAGLSVRGMAELVADGELVLGESAPVTVETPFRVASVTKWFTASLAVMSLHLDQPLEGGATARRLLSHTAGLRQEANEQLPEVAQGLWSYSNAGYWAVASACAAVCGDTFARALQAHVLDPLALLATGFDEPGRPARGHVQEGETGQRPVGLDAYPVSRHASGGLWSTVGDLLRFGEHQLGAFGPLSPAQRETLRTPQAQALGAAYGLGCWTRRLAGGRTAYDHDGSVAGYQSHLLVVPEERAVLAVLTNSWRGSSVIRHVVKELGLVPADAPRAEPDVLPVPGRYALDGDEASVELRGRSVRVAESAIDPITTVRRRLPAYPGDPLGDGVFGFAGGLLMSHRFDFPRPGVARVGWVALPAVRA